MVPEQLGRIQDRIDSAARRTGRNPNDITLVAVTKTLPLDRILPFIRAGVRHLAENRVQEALSKYQSPEGERVVDATLHLIGPLQSNKAKKAAVFFDMVQSIDRFEIAEALSRQAVSLGKMLPCLVEVKVSTEPSKAGLPPEQLDEFLGRLRTLPALDIQGLMGIAPFDAQGDAARPYFERLRVLWEKAKLKVLSMGMSSDFEAAIAEGSTMVRIGTALFGARA